MASFTWLGLGVTAARLEITGTVLLTRAERNATLVTNLARKDARVYQALVTAMRYAAYASLLEIFAVLAVAVSVDMGRIPKNSMIAKQLIGDAIREVENTETNDGTAPAGNEQPQPQPQPTPGWSSYTPQGAVG